jgi:hypothetical protein
MSETIYFNGKKYNSVSEMPPNVRQLYARFNRFLADEDQDGVPDMIQSGGLAGIKETVNMIKDIAQFSGTEGFEAGRMSMVRVTDNSIYINGKEYTSEAEMPHYIRQEYQRIVNTAQDGREDIFDESWRQVDREKYFDPHDDEMLNRQISRQVSNADAPIETVDSTSRFIVIALAALLVLGCMAAAWFFIF